MTVPAPEADESRDRRGFKVHPIDLLFALLAVFLAVAAYTFLFERQHVPRPVDPLLGATIVVEFPVEREWQRAFAKKGEQVLVDEVLLCDVVDPPPGDTPEVRAVRLRVRDRSGQRPEAMGRFRRGIRRGSVLTVSNRKSEVRATVLEVTRREDAP